MSIERVDKIGITHKYRISHMTDEELVAIYSSTKDEDTFEEIINRYSDCIYSTAYRITNDHHESEEILQEVLLIISQKMYTFRVDSKFSTWLYRIILNASYGYLRKKKRHENVISLEDYAPYDYYGTLGGKVKIKEWSNNPYLIIYRKEALEIIDRAINQLPEQYRIVLHLRDIEQLSGSEISQILGVSVGAVKSRLHRARLFLRDKISDYFHEWRKR